MFVVTAMPSQKADAETVPMDELLMCLFSVSSSAGCVSWVIWEGAMLGARSDLRLEVADGGR